MFNKKSLIGTEGLNKKEIFEIIDLANRFKTLLQEGRTEIPTLSGKQIVLSRQQEQEVLSK